MSKSVVQQCHGSKQTHRSRSKNHRSATMSRSLPRRDGAAPGQALLHLPYLRQALFSDSQRFYQNGNVTHLFRNGIHVLFVIHDELSHKAVPLL